MFAKEEGLEYKKTAGGRIKSSKARTGKTVSGFFEMNRPMIYGGRQMYWIAAAVIIAALLWFYFNVISPLPEFPPLETDPDDPLLKAATEQAKSTIDQFKELFRTYPEDAFVKLYFVSNTGTVEHLGAHVEKIEGDELHVVLVTSPVTHKGRLDRNYICTFNDIEDWQVTDIEGNIYGGFTQRVMFEIARQKGVQLPQELLEMEQQYVNL